MKFRRFDSSRRHFQITNILISKEENKIIFINHKNQQQQQQKYNFKILFLKFSTEL